MILLLEKNWPKIGGVAVMKSPLADFSPLFLGADFFPPYQVLRIGLNI